MKRAKINGFGSDVLLQKFKHLHANLLRIVWDCMSTATVLAAQLPCVSRLHMLVTSCRSGHKGIIPPPSLMIAPSCSIFVIPNIRPLRSFIGSDIRGNCCRIDLMLLSVATNAGGTEK